MYSKIGVIYEVFKKFGPQQKIYLQIEFSQQKYSKIGVLLHLLIPLLANLVYEWPLTLNSDDHMHFFALFWYSVSIIIL